MDLSSTIKLSDANIMKACGRWTVHEGARHDLTMSVKIARLEQQEPEFMAKYGKKSQPARVSVCVTPTPLTSQSAAESKSLEETAELLTDTKVKKKKKKSCKHQCEPAEEE